MTPDNNRFRDYCGITAWHDAGIDGSIGLTASAEFFEGPQATEHGYVTWRVFKEVAHGRHVTTLDSFGIQTDQSWDRVADGILAQGVDTYWASLKQKYVKGFDNALERVVGRCTVLYAMGNDGQDVENQLVESPYVYGIGAVSLMAGTNKVALTPYSNTGEHVDFVGFAGIWVDNKHFVGTSCATPFVCGQMALVNHLAIQQIGRPLSSMEMYDLMKSWARDVYQPGWDAKTGHGVIIMPPPETVDLRKYAREANTIEIIEHNWQWSWELTRRKATDAIVLHHAAATEAAPEQIDVSHKSRGWSGIGYHYYVRKDGGIHRGRPEWASGAHVENENYNTIGICFEGNFEIETMPPAQLDAGRELLADILTRYPTAVIKGHRDYMATACPGRSFPFDEMTKEDDTMTGKEIYTALMEYVNDMQESGWSQKEGHFKKATNAGVLDGTRPQAPVTREQLAAVLGRIGLFYKG